MPFKNLLKKVDAVNWAELRTNSYVKHAKDIPNYFRNILSHCPQTRRDAHDILYWNLNGDFFVATASPVAIPFLIELLTIEATPDKHEILFLLGEILRYPISEPWDNEPEWVSRMRPIRIKVAEEVWAGLEIYIRLLGENDDLTQVSAAHLLFESKRFPQEHEQILKALYINLKARILSKSEPELLREFEFQHWDKYWIDTSTDKDDETPLKE